MSLGGRMWRHGARIVGGIAAVLVAVGINAGPASASSRLYIGSSGYGEFQSYGDHWYACDIHTDGYGVRVDWNVPATGRTGNVADTSGNDGNCAHSNVDIVEGREVHYRVCLVNNGVAV